MESGKSHAVEKTKDHLRIYMLRKKGEERLIQ